VASAFISIRLYNLYVAKEVYGVVLVGLGIISYLPIMSAGFRMVLNQRMLADPDPEAAKATARFGQALQTYFLLFVLLAGMALMAGYSQVPSTRALALPILVFIATGAAAAATFHAGSQLALLVAFGEQVISTIIQSLWGLLGLLILWITFRLGWGVWAFPASIGFGALLTLACVRVALVTTKHDVPLLVWQAGRDFLARLKAIWWPSLDCLHNQIATAVVFTGDLIIVGILVGPGDAAVYGIVSRVVALSRQVLQSLSEAAWPRLTQELDSGRKATMMRKVDRLNAWSVGCWYGAMIPTLLPFLDSWVKTDWVASPLLAVLIIARSFIISLASPHSYGLISAGRFKALARLTQFEAIVGVVLGVILSPMAGVIGTAVAYLLASSSMSAWQLTKEYFRFAQDTHWVTEWWAIWWRGLVGIGAGLAIATAIWSIERTGFHAYGWMAIFAGGIGYAVPIGMILIWWRVVGRVP
jgi:O-antigen/teichoic acid export membrane protein